MKKRSRKPRGERVCLLSGPRDQLEANRTFYESIRWIFKAWHLELKILDTDEEVSKIKIRRRLMRELYENRDRRHSEGPMLGEFSVLVADCREETEKVYQDIFDWTTYHSYMIVIQPLQPHAEFLPHRKVLVKVVLRSGERQWELDPLYETKIRYLQDESLDPALPDSLLVAISRVLRRIREEQLIKEETQKYK